MAHSIVEGPFTPLPSALAGSGALLNASVHLESSSGATADVSQKVPQQVAVASDSLPSGGPSSRWFVRGISRPAGSQAQSIRLATDDGHTPALCVGVAEAGKGYESEDEK